MVPISFDTGISDDSTGQPAAKASKRGKLNPSFKDGITSAEAFCNNSINLSSGTNPWSITNSEIPKDFVENP